MLGRIMVAKGPSDRGKGIAVDRTGYLSAPKFRHKAPVAYPALRLAAFLAGLQGISYLRRVGIGVSCRVFLFLPYGVSLTGRYQVT